jgi:hypothetical protein
MQGPVGASTVPVPTASTPIRWRPAQRRSSGSPSPSLLSGLLPASSPGRPSAWMCAPRGRAPARRPCTPHPSCSRCGTGRTPGARAAWMPSWRSPSGACPIVVPSSPGWPDRGGLEPHPAIDELTAARTIPSGTGPPAGCVACQRSPTIPLLHQQESGSGGGEGEFRCSWARLCLIMLNRTAFARCRVDMPEETWARGFCSHSTGFARPVR